MGGMRQPDGTGAAQKAESSRYWGRRGDTRTAYSCYEFGTQPCDGLGTAHSLKRIWQQRLYLSEGLIGDVGVRYCKWAGRKLSLSTAGFDGFPFSKILS